MTAIDFESVDRERRRFKREPTEQEWSRYGAKALDRLAEKHPEMFVNGVYREDALANRLWSCMVVWLVNQSHEFDCRDYPT